MNKIRIMFLGLLLPFIALYGIITNASAISQKPQEHIFVNTIQYEMKQNSGVKRKMSKNLLVVDTSLNDLGTFKLTAYYGFPILGGRPIDENGNEIIYTSTGNIAKSKHTIAVDPKVIPYGSIVNIEINGEEHEYIAEDCGGAIKGNIIDIYFDTKEECVNFGVQYGNVYILNT